MPPWRREPGHRRRWISATDAWIAERILDAAQAIARPRASPSSRCAGSATSSARTRPRSTVSSATRASSSSSSPTVSSASAPRSPPASAGARRSRSSCATGLSRYRSHPDLAMRLAVQPDDTPSLERIADRTLGLLRAAGLTIPQATAFFQIIENHVVGTGVYYSLVESSLDRRLTDPEAMRRAYALLPADELPHAVEAAPHLFPDFDESYDRATDLILDAIEHQAEKPTEALPIHPAPTTETEQHHDASPWRARSSPRSPPWPSPRAARPRRTAARRSPRPRRARATRSARPPRPRPARPRKVTWATYRDVGTIDPIQAFDYPENTAITTLCDSLPAPGPRRHDRPGPRDAHAPERHDARDHAQGRPDVLGRQAGDAPTTSSSASSARPTRRRAASTGRSSAASRR